MKLVFIATSCLTCYLIYRASPPLREFQSAEILVIASAGLACLINHDCLWTFSIYLESVAILPQLFLISKTGEAETITSHYLFALGSYRALYILNWIYRLVVEGQYDVIAIAAGCLQTALYADFFYLYVTKVLK
uniref:ER lumen protein-retaining receptor n=1 Tax=Macrostomum lignano TaxID=282301 RepID=A0A1I8F485_9PLAT